MTICFPSTSASVAIITRWYLILSILKSSAIAVPKAMINDFISFEAKILSRRALSIFKIFPRKGRTAWNLLSLADLQEPPADSPSTMKISDSSGFLEIQSANFPGKAKPSKIPFLKTVSFAILAALLALAARTQFSIIALAS